MITESVFEAVQSYARSCPRTASLGMWSTIQEVQNLSDVLSVTECPALSVAVRDGLRGVGWTAMVGNATTKEELMALEAKCSTPHADHPWATVPTTPFVPKQATEPLRQNVTVSKWRGRLGAALLFAIPLVFLFAMVASYSVTLALIAAGTLIILVGSITSGLHLLRMQRVLDREAGS